MMLLRSIILLLIPSTFVDGCGGFFCQNSAPVVQAGEAIAFGVEGNKVTMHVQILYEGPAEGFSWLLPMPIQPTEIGVGSDLLFSTLYQQTLPRFMLEVNNGRSTETCSQTALIPKECPLIRDDCANCSSSAWDDELAQEDVGAVVLERGSVGPYDFVILEAADNNPSSVLEWLNENGYDQPEGSAPLLNYYAKNNHVFVALRLQKQAETGEIQPLVLEFTMPGGSDSGSSVSRRAVACVPIQLTRVAATNNMPIQVYIFGQARAVPLNFLELQLDDSQADWLGCSYGFSANRVCYDNDYRTRFDRAASLLVNHSFVTEFAGASKQLHAEMITEQVQVSQEEIGSVNSMREFQRGIQFRLPRIPLVNTIVQEYTEKEGSSFDATALAQELEDKVLKPARDAQDFVDRFPYMTRLYGRLSPQDMTKDPFFGFKKELPPVDNVHRAVGIPICTSDQPSGLNITVESGAWTAVPATLTCSGLWTTRQEPFILSPNQVAAIQLASWGFEGDPGVVVSRQEDGSFDYEAIAAAINFGDSLVMNQSIFFDSSTVYESSNKGSSAGRKSLQFHLWEIFFFCCALSVASFCSWMVY